MITKEQYLDAVKKYTESIEIIKQFQVENSIIGISEKAIKKDDLLIDLLASNKVFSGRISTVLRNDILKTNYTFNKNSTFQDLINSFLNNDILRHRNFGKKSKKELKLLIEANV
jgi:hypothetical protein